MRYRLRSESFENQSKIGEMTLFKALLVFVVLGFLALLGLAIFVNWGFHAWGNFWADLLGIKRK